MLKKVGLIGLGYIGQTIIDAINEEKLHDSTIQAVYDIDKKKIEATKKQYPAFRIMEHITDFQDCDIIIECAVQKVVADIFDAIVEEKKYFIPMSIGAFITIPELYQKFKTLERTRKEKIILVSGAIGGFDCIESIKSEGIISAKLRTRKPNKVFSNSSYLKENGIELDSNSPVVIFQGNAKEAATHFPRSINVAARLAISTLGPEETDVEVIADPSILQNIHQIEIKSKVGNYTFTFENNPSPSNPKTSWLAALSAVYAINRI